MDSFILVSFWGNLTPAFLYFWVFFTPNDRTFGVEIN